MLPHRLGRRAPGDHHRAASPQGDPAGQHQLGQQRPGQASAQRTRLQQRLAGAIVMAKKP